MESFFLRNLLLENQEHVFEIHTAASIGCEELVADILKRSPQLANSRNVSGWTPLMFSACLGHLGTTRLLLDAGANVRGALVTAAKNGHVELVAMLLQAGAPSDDQDGSAVGHAAKFGHRGVLELLLERGASVDSADEKGLTPLMLAAAAGHEMVVKDLLRLGANVHLESKSCETARSLAVRNGHLKVARLLERNNSESGLESLLQELRLSKYLPLFEKQGIDLQLFYMLNEADLKEIGIKIVGPRKALCNAIAEQQQKMDPRILSNRLLVENKRLMQAKEELESAIYREMELRKAAEKNLNEGIKSLKNFSDVVFHTLSHSVALQEKLKQVLASMRQAAQEGETVLPLLAHADKLASEILCQSRLSLQQTTSRS